MKKLILSEEVKNSLDVILSREGCSVVSVAGDILDRIYNINDADPKVLQRYHIDVVKYILVYHRIDNPVRDNFWCRCHDSFEFVSEELKSKWGTSFRNTLSVALKCGASLDEISRLVLFSMHKDSSTRQQRLAVICHIIAAEDCFRVFGKRTGFPRGLIWFVMKNKYLRSLHAHYKDIC